AAMLIAERDFEMDHPLAMAVEPEMAGLDDPGMHRSDCNLMDLGTRDREEIRIADCRAAGWKAHRLQPGMALRLDIALLADLPLEVMRCRAVRRERLIGISDERRSHQDFATRIIRDRREQLRFTADSRQPDQQQ